MLIAKVIVSALVRAQQETLQFHHIKNKTKKPKVFGLGVCPSSRGVFVSQSMGCHFLPFAGEAPCPWDGGLGPSLP